MSIVATPPHIALAIAGSDPTGGAGLQADLRTFAAFGIHGLSVVSALTAQSTVGVRAVEPVLPDFVTKQLETLLSDITPDALKTGMLHDAGVVRRVADCVKRFGLKNLVVDPLYLSSSGAALLDDDGFFALRDELIPLARVVTPNLAEAERLTGMKIMIGEDLKSAAECLLAMGPEAVVITGGHWDEEAADYYMDSNGPLIFKASKIPGEFHGTGCVFSAALAAGLALGEEPVDAVNLAHCYVMDAIARAARPGAGAAILGAFGVDG
ncbi:MAG: bifunctional hydroxymethylpyrimidine kinase/phosphomethylpyrimidine kinase [Nitrospirae bacterium]|nr:bifunctional hydroxymethylpyrimidine kinase/phosphomethylpyrimidine kinase [Nitrospirota bacterium]